MYPQSVKTRAYTFFVVKGYTCETIARMLRKEYPKINANTIRAWSEEKSKNRRSWIDEKDSIENDVVERVHEATVSRTVEIRAKAKILTDEIFRKIIDKSAPEGKTLEGMIYAFKAISTLETQLEKEANEKEKLSPAQVIHIILEIFQSNPVIAKAIRSEWSSVSERLHKQLLE